jgi:hypothetical protein
VFDYDPSAGPAAPPPPPEMTGNPRYVYLLTRLRGRQITMEEATELFALQQGMIRSAAGRSRAYAPPGQAPRAPTAPTGTEPVALGMTDDGLALSFLVLGAGAGLFAALLKRAREGSDPGSAAP